MNDDFSLTLVVDQLAALNSQIKSLQDEADGLKAILINAEQPIVESARYRASISLVEPAALVDWKTIAAKLGASRQLIAANSRPREPYYRVSLTDL